IKDKKGNENLAADHLSRLENPDLETLNKEAIRDSFPDKHLMVVQVREIAEDPWYADYANFLVSKIIPHGLTYHLRKKFLSDIKHYIWDDPYLFKSCPDGIIRRCVFGKELQEILEHCHMRPTRGHYRADITARKVFESRFYWRTIFRDVTRVPKALISDHRTHFCNSLLEKTLKKYGRTVNGNRKEWADKFDDALWPFKTAYKSPIRSTSFRIVYGKAFHLTIDMEHKAHWALKNVNLDLDIARKHRIKRWHDAKIMDKVFHEGD
ncbi:reverse transcriptase domain-containing protein, partial [Tanacetum coccineum]